MKAGVEESDNKENSISSRGTSKELIPCVEKDGGYRSVNNFKMLNQFIWFFHFKMEGLS